VFRSDGFIVLVLMLSVNNYFHVFTDYFRQDKGARRRLVWLAQTLSPLSTYIIEVACNAFKMPF